MTFKTEYRRLRKEMMTSINPDVAIVLLLYSNTKSSSDILKNLGLRNPAILISSFNHPNLYWNTAEDPKRKIKNDQKRSLHIPKPWKRAGSTLNRIRQAKNIKEILVANKIKGCYAYRNTGLDSKASCRRQDKF